MLEPANQNLAGRIPPVRDPWDEGGDNLVPAKGIALGVAIMAILVAAAVAAVIWL